MKPILILLLSGCAPMPITGGATPAALYTYPMPSCIVFCSSHVSAIREDATSVGSGTLTTGAKSNTSSGSMGP